MTRPEFTRPSPLTRLPSGHFHLDATGLSLGELAPLLARLHPDCSRCRVVFLTAGGPQIFAVGAGGEACCLRRLPGSG